MFLVMYYRVYIVVCFISLFEEKEPLESGGRVRGGGSACMCMFTFDVYMSEFYKNVF